MRLAERVRASLAATVTDHVPHSGDVDGGPDTPTSAAAVLIAMTDRPEPGIILTQRPATMRRHAGQVAFPGGRVDPHDDGAIDAALREAEEEVELPRDQVEVVDTLAPYLTITGFSITPVVGIIPPDIALKPHHREVDAVFEVPIAYLFDPDRRTERRMMIEGRARVYSEIMWNDRRIWGATAAILQNLAARLRW